MTDGEAGRRSATSERPSVLSLVRLRDDTAKPLYRQIEEQLRDLIVSGSLPPGVILPAERQLADSLGVSRVTVQRAYAELRHDELLVPRGRLGFLVRRRPEPVRPGMDRLKGFTEEMRELGKIPSSRILERIITEDRSIASIFGLPSTSPFLRLTRVRFGDDVPMSREIAWYNVRAVPELEHGDLTGSVYGFLAQHEGGRLVRCEQTVEATLPTPAECEIFDFDTPIPCLLIKRHSYNRRSTMIEYVEGLFRGDAYRYRLSLSI
ncbi:GntR family transcriptional regulator [Methylobacterium sp. C33D]